MKNDWKKNVILFITSQTISLFGSSLVQYVLMWHVTLDTKSGLMMTISVLCGFLPMFLLSPFAGVWADRYNRRVLIALADSGIAVATLILALLFYLGYGSIWLIFVITIIRSLGTAIQIPAVNAFIPQMVPSEHLTRVSSINGSIQPMVTLISLAISAALMYFWKLEQIMLIDVGTALIAVAIITLLIKVPPHAKASVKNAESYFDDIKEGFTYIKNHEFIKKFFVFCVIFFFLIVPGAFLTPLQVTLKFGDDVWRLLAIEVAFSAGMLAGGAFMAYWGGFNNKVRTMIFSYSIVSICSILLGVVPNFVMYIVVMGLIGFALPMFNIPSMVLIQQKVEGDMHGRVFSIMNMLSSITMPMGMLVFGPLAEFVKIEWMLIVTGILMIIQTIVTYRDKVLIKAGIPVSES